MSERELELLKRGAGELGQPLDDEQLHRLRTFYEVLVDWNQRVNLTRVTAWDDVCRRHFLDSLSLLAFVPEATRRVVDVGSGAGFPGIVWKVARPDWDVTLVEAAAKKAAFLERAVEALGLEGVPVLHGRAEDLGRDPAHREAYDVAVGRAVAKLAVLAEYLVPLVRIGGVMLAPKGPSPSTEVEEARSAITSVGGAAAEVQTVNVPGWEASPTVVVIRKRVRTPAKFPRRAGLPKKRPLR